MPYNFVDMLRHLCSRPYMTVGSNSFDQVALFLHGYDAALLEFAPEERKATSLYEFGRWLSYTHEGEEFHWEISGKEVETNLVWSSKFQRMYPSDADALAALPDLYQQFLDDPNRKRWPDWPSRDEESSESQ